MWTFFPTSLSKRFLWKQTHFWKKKKRKRLNKCPFRNSLKSCQKSEYGLSKSLYLKKITCRRTMFRTLVKHLNNYFNLQICLSIRPTVHPFVFQSFHLSIFLFVCPKTSYNSYSFVTKYCL